MPLYDYRCERSGRRFERAVKLAEYRSTQYCACNAPGTRIISATRIAVENVDYLCPITDKWIGSKQAHEENLKQHDCRVLEGGEKEMKAAARQKVDDAFEASVEETVERGFDAMPSEKKEKLANELLSGADIAVERQS